MFQSGSTEKIISDYASGVLGSMFLFSELKYLHVSLAGQNYNLYQVSVKFQFFLTDTGKTNRKDFTGTIQKGINIH